MQRRINKKCGSLLLVPTAEAVELSCIQCHKYTINLYLIMHLKCNGYLFFNGENGGVICCLAAAIV
jgi:hypothetical protein